MKVIAILGRMRSGKSTVSDYIEERYGYKRIQVSNLVREQCESMGHKNPDRKQLQTIQGEFNDSSWLIERLNAKLVRGNDYVVDSIRDPKILQNLEYNFWGELVVVLVKSRRKDRLRRSGLKTLGKLRVVDERDNALGLQKAIQHAEYSVDNYGTMDDLHTRVNTVMGRINKWFKSQ